MPTKTDSPRVYAACLSSYNSGRLHGAWIDCNQDEEAIMAEISAMLAKSPTPSAEEWAFHDYENFQGISIGENESAETLAEIGQFLGEHGELGGALVSHFGGVNYLEAAKEALEQNYAGEYDSTLEWAEESLKDQGVLDGLTENLRNYFNFEAYARDCALGGGIYTIEISGKVHIFTW